MPLHFRLVFSSKSILCSLLILSNHNNQTADTFRVNWKCFEHTHKTKTLVYFRWTDVFFLQGNRCSIKWIEEIRLDKLKSWSQRSREWCWIFFSSVHVTVNWEKKLKTPKWMSTGQVSQKEHTEGNLLYDVTLGLFLKKISVLLRWGW